MAPCWLRSSWGRRSPWGPHPLAMLPVPLPPAALLACGAPSCPAHPFHTACDLSLQCYQPCAWLSGSPRVTSAAWNPEAPAPRQVHVLPGHSAPKQPPRAPVGTPNQPSHSTLPSPACLGSSGCDAEGPWVRGPPPGGGRIQHPLSAAGLPKSRGRAPEGSQPREANRTHGTKQNKTIK